MGVNFIPGIVGKSELRGLADSVFSGNSLRYGGGCFRDLANQETTNLDLGFRETMYFNFLHLIIWTDNFEVIHWLIPSLTNL